MLSTPRIVSRPITSVPQQSIMSDEGNFSSSWLKPACNRQRKWYRKKSPYNLAKNWQRGDILDSYRDTDGRRRLRMVLKIKSGYDTFVARSG